MPRDAVLIGTATAPSQPQPSTTDRNSIRLPAISATRSPRRTPWAASSAAQRAACAGASPYSSVPPGAWTRARAPWRAAWSISIAGNVCACMLVFPLLASVRDCLPTVENSLGINYLYVKFMVIIFLINQTDMRGNA